MNLLASCIVPEWAAPARVRALCTTREGGISAAPWHSFNLASHVGDDSAAVAGNRARLRELLPAEPLWLEQVHGTRVYHDGTDRCADAVVSRKPGEVCAIMTADCLPVLFTTRRGDVVAAAHAGWRGLCAGVLEATLASMDVEPADVLAWLGPAIGPVHFEVGPEVKRAFIERDAQAFACFRPGQGDRWMADIYGLARQRLQGAGVPAASITGGAFCTVQDEARFFSYRRDGVTGRMASLIWIAQPD